MAVQPKVKTKRGKASYFMAILGVTMVLFLLGLIGWMIINANALANHFKENVEVNVYLRDPLPKDDSVSIMQYISTQPYVKTFEFVTKETAKKRYIADGNEDWGNILEQNPLPQSINFRVKREFVDSLHMKNIQTELTKQSSVLEVQYPVQVVNNLDANFRKLSLILFGLAAIIAIIVIVLIDNTIRLSMFSNRFTIKTMQMVGATRWFIIKPMDMRAILHGAISGAIASAAIYLLIYFAERYYPPLKAIQDPLWIAILFLTLIVLGIAITLTSTHLSALKYLRKKLEDLY